MQTINDNTTTYPLPSTSASTPTSNSQPARPAAMQLQPPDDKVDPFATDDMRRAERAQVSPYPQLLKLARGVVWIVWAVVAFTAAVLGLAFVFRLAGANGDASFVDWVYRSSERAMKPFRGIFPTRDLGGESVFDASLLFAACAYIVGALALDAVRRWLGIKVEQQERAVEAAKAQVAAGR